MTTIIIDKKEHIVYTDTLANSGDRVKNYFSGTTKAWEVCYGGEEYIITGCGYLDLIRSAAQEFRDSGELSFKPYKYGVSIAEEGTLIAIVHKESKKINLYRYSPELGVFGGVKKANFISTRLAIETDRWMVFGSGSEFALGVLMLTDDIQTVYDVVSKLDQATCAIYNEYKY